MVIPNAICMHEEDYGISWKHTDFRTEEVEVRRSRRLVISMICTVGNYEYGFFWYFYNDASIEVEVKLSGVLTTGAIEDGELPRWGKMVAPGIYGPNHQHFFNFRLDMSIDGAGNSVYEVDSVPEPDPALNPHHNAWITQDTLVASEADGARDWNWSTGRYWKVSNPSKVNELGQPVAYKLTPKDIVPVMVQEGSHIYDRARFVQHNLWVTRYDPTEKFAAGDYMYQSADAQGLPEFIADDAATGGHRRGALVHRRSPPRGAAGGLAGDAVRLHRVPPQAGGILRRQSGAGSAAVAAEGVSRLASRGSSGGRAGAGVVGSRRRH